jgi:hypothetical protein
MQHIYRNYDKRLSIILPALYASEMRHTNQESSMNQFVIFVPMNKNEYYTTLITDVMSFSYLFTKKDMKTIS